jgi:hypothetical protein
LSFRDDHDAALMRADAAERERALLVVENERLVAELADAREWLGGPRKRLFLLGGGLVVGLGLVLAGVGIGRATVDDPPPVKMLKAPPMPSIAGLMVAHGPDLGHWMMNATRCVPRSDGIELTTIGTTERSFWVGKDQVELELPGGTVFLTRARCAAKFIAYVTHHDDMVDGAIELDCSFDTNQLQGRIDFKNCR